MNDAAWPELPLKAWEPTCATLHMYLQIAGKIRLTLGPAEPEFAHAALYLTARGLTTGPMPHRNVTCQIDFDFLAHQLYLSTSRGGIERIALVPRTVRDFYAAVMGALEALGTPVTINPMPQEIADPIPFPEDITHASYDAPWVTKFWRILSSVDAVFRRFRAPYRGRHTPINVWWGSLDLSYSRYSGRPAAPPPNAGYILRESMDAEEVAAGFWPGDARYPAPAFYAYAYPKPAGIETTAIEPAGAAWSTELGEFLLPYETVRTARSPDSALFDFLVSTYEAGRTLCRWP